MVEPHAPPAPTQAQLPLVQAPLQQSLFFAQVVPKPGSTHAHFPLTQLPEQHSASRWQVLLTGAHWQVVLHTPLQQVAADEQLAPLVEHTRQVPPTHSPLQQSSSPVQLPEVLHWQVALHEPVQQSPAALQLLPTVAQAHRPLVPSQFPLQQSAAEPQATPIGRQAHTPLLHDDEQHCASPVQPTPTSLQPHKLKMNKLVHTPLQQSPAPAHIVLAVPQQTPPRHRLARRAASPRRRDRPS